MGRIFYVGGAAEQSEIKRPLDTSGCMYRQFSHGSTSDPIRILKDH